MKKAWGLLFEMLGFLMIFPTTFLAAMDGLNLIREILGIL
jgi:hypothetical protein